MVKQLKGVPEKNVKSENQFLRMQQDAALMQGVSSRLQIKRELQAAAAHPQQLVKSCSKRLQKPVDDPEFITSGAGYGRTSREQLRKSHVSDFGKQAEQRFGHIGQASGVDDGMDFL